MKVAFRTDASARIGTGHLARCITLGQELRRRGAAVRFVVGDHGADWYWRLHQAGFATHLLPRNTQKAGKVADGDYAAWLGVLESRDADQTLGVVGNDVDLLVVDHYGLGAEWEARVRAEVGDLMAIDDLVDRPHYSDILLDQNLGNRVRGIRRESHGASTASSEGSVRRELYGPRYALLDPAFRCARELSIGDIAKVQRILVYFGGSDPRGLTRLAVEVLAEDRFRDLQADVVLGPATVDSNLIRSLSGSEGRIRVHDELSSLAPLLMRADLAIGAAGATSWERACLGIPSVVVAIAKNQLGIAETLQRAGAVHYLGTAAELTRDGLVEALSSLTEDTAARRKMAAKAYELVDGWGAVRVGEVLMPSSADAVEVRPSIPGGHDREPATRSAERANSIFRITLRDLPIGTASVIQASGFREVSLDLDEIVQDRDWHGRILRKVDSAHRALLSSSRAGTLRSPLRLTSGRRNPTSGGARIGVVSDATSWLNPYLAKLTGTWLREGHLVDWCHDAADVADSEACFYLSYGSIVANDVLARHRHNLVVHASDLPQGRGWSPMTWSILSGGTSVTVTLLEAVEQVDAGRIYEQRRLCLSGHELVDQWRAQQADVLLRLCRWAVDNLDNLADHARPQRGEPSWLPRRRPADSRLDPESTLAEQFDLLRVVDNERYPAFLEHRGHRYRLAIELDGPVERS